MQDLLVELLRNQVLVLHIRSEIRPLKLVI